MMDPRREKVLSQFVESDNIIEIPVELLRAALLGATKQFIKVTEKSVQVLAKDLANRDDERSQLLSMTLQSFLTDELQREGECCEREDTTEIQSDCCSTDNDSLCNCSCNSN